MSNVYIPSINKLKENTTKGGITWVKDSEKGYYFETALDEGKEKYITTIYKRCPLNKLSIVDYYVELHYVLKIYNTTTDEGALALVVYGTDKEPDLTEALKNLYDEASKTAEDLGLITFNKILGG